VIEAHLGSPDAALVPRAKNVLKAEAVTPVGISHRDGYPLPVRQAGALPPGFLRLAVARETLALS